MQSRRASLVEALANQATGIAVNVLLAASVLPLFGFVATPASLAATTAVFFVASVVRVYVLRRLFNHLTLKKMRSNE